MAKVVVTGAGGFVGRALACRLAALGHEVHAIVRSRGLDLGARGITVHQIDLGGNTDALAPQLGGADVLFHAAAKVDMWGAYEDFYRSNVIGTRNVIAICRAAKIPHLIFTSSPSVIAGGGDLRGVNEDMPYPTSHLAYYPATKATAEREVLLANDGQDLRTVALRPHLIFGPGDTNLVPTILAMASAGRLVRVGSGKNRTDLTFIDDCVEAHLLAWRTLQNNAQIGGKAYFITQGDPVNLWGFINEILQRHGLAPVRRAVPAWLANALAPIFEYYARMSGTGEPRLTRLLACEMSTDHYFDIARAKRDLGYHPSCTVREALERTFPHPGCS